jgi:predicted PurR-regulated permease PerM
MGKMKQVVQKVELSYKTVVFTVFFILSLWVVYEIRDILLQVFVALLITTILDPLVTKFSKYKIPRFISILLVYFLIIAGLIFVISAVIPPLVEQTTLFATSLPGLMKDLSLSSEVGTEVIQQVISQLGSVPSQIAKFVFGVFGNVISVITVLVFAYYLLSERQKLVVQLAGLIGRKKEEDSLRVLGVLEEKLGGWARGQLTLMLVIGVASYIGLLLLGIPYALPLAILAGVLEVVPYIGPVISAIPAVLIGFGISPFMGFAALVLYFLIQQTENYLFVPRIMQHSTGINPVITLLVLAIGLRLAGMVGLLLSIPVYITSQVLLKEYYASRE